MPRNFTPNPPARRWLLFTAPMLFLGAGLARMAQGEPTPTAQAATQAAAQAGYEAQLKPFLSQYCLGCHSKARAVGGVDLSKYADVTMVQKDQAMWRKALTQIRERSMPPRGVPQPKQEQRVQITEWLEHTLDNVPEDLLPPNPGRVLIHRLSRLEYNNTVRDLFGVDTRPADKFPADGGGGGGFDNNADTLFVPPILMERYLAAASDILSQAPADRLFPVRPGKTLTAREAARKLLAGHASRAYRRPVEPAEVESLLKLYDTAVLRKDGWENSVRFALKAVLVSPHFLFRIERDQPGTEPYLVSDYELASRLSYFLWSSMPDDAVFTLAAKKQLRVPAVLEGQIRRMLNDPKASALADSFAGQWLRIRELYTSAQPDPRRFPEYSSNLRDAMYRETTEFFASVLRDNASLLRLVDADYTYANEELAKHYGLTGVTGPELRRVKLADRARGGILTQASVLTVTSFPQRTSPVLRGKWLLEQVLGATIPPPPPNAGGLPANDAPRDGLSFRQRLEAHRTKPECASCHVRMDPMGFGLENFDAVGRWRTEVRGEKVDPSGELPTGEKFSGPEELKGIVLNRKDEFLRNITEKMLAYALGRGLEPYDLASVRKIVAAVKADNYRSTTLVREIVNSYPFQYRKN